jgi:hypothetical protein
MPPCRRHFMPCHFAFLSPLAIFAIDIFTLAIDDYAFQIDVPFHFH